MKALWLTFTVVSTLCLLLLPSCAGPEGAAGEGNALVLKYKDFGPQAAAYELLGHEWPQWETQGSGDPSELAEIGVVVYRGLPLSVVQQRYPVIRGQQDYRYVTYDQAVDYCDRMLQESGDLLGHLKQTRRTIKAHLGEPRR